MVQVICHICIWNFIFTKSNVFSFVCFFLSMTETDRHSFNFDTTSVDWKVLISTMIMSVRTYNLKQTIDQLEAAEKSFNYLKLLHFMVKFFICLIILCIYWRTFGGDFMSFFIVACLCYYFI